MTAPSTSLAALDAVVIDTETTGLDARSARLIQIGMVRLFRGAIDRDTVFDRLVDPGIEVPAVSTAVHGLATSDVRGQPPFAALQKEVSDYIGVRPVIGHTLAYDFAVLKREHDLAGLAWHAPRALDLRVLARLAAPGLADHSLDRICDWLGITVTGRHTARGDAIATAEAFLALVPRLRQQGLRTLAEVEAAGHALAERDMQSGAGAATLEGPAALGEDAIRGLDVFAYRHRNRDVMSAPPAVMPADTRLSASIDDMLKRGLSSVFVTLADGQTGIVTERDALRAVATHGAAGLEMPLSTFANAPLITVADDAFVYRAIGRMQRLDIRHLGVRDATGAIVGALTPRNLLRNRATDAIMIGDAIVTATSGADLAAAWSETPRVARGLIAEAVEARTIASVISSEICNITRRAAELAEAHMAETGRGAPPCRYAVLVLGSAGRGESLLAADQDNAIVFEHGEPGGAEDTWFRDLGEHMAATLDAAHIVFCKGGVMAKNAAWRHNRRGWFDLVETWIRRQKPSDLLNVDIFFDAVPVHGALDLGREIWTAAFERAGKSRDFLMMLSELARQWSSPVTMFGGFTKTDGRLDLKKYGLMPIFTGARVLALRHGVVERSTKARLDGVVARGHAQSSVVTDILEAQNRIMATILAQQIEDGRRGVPLSPRVDVERLDRDARRDLKAAFAGVAAMVDMVAEGRV
jgi:DNA polymerase-3 subunit epsilon/CBS domain-containing protein